jgi:DNA replication and repair protein RecF
MHVQTLSLTDFRNYEELEFKCESGINVLYGPNAQGKSAILEAIYLLATSKSHRTSRDMDLVRVGQSMARACAEVSRTARNDVVVEVFIGKAEKKVVRIDKTRRARIAELIGQLNAVIFSSLDIDMVRGEPDLRRRFLNLEISQVSPGYVYSLGRYRQALQQRNSLLKEMKLSGGDAAALDVWDSQLAGYGAAVIAKRAEFVTYLAGAASELYATLAAKAEELKVTYKPNPEVDQGSAEQEVASRLASALAARREMDIARGTTSVGPHRDDLSISVGSLPAREYGSQGQQRTAAVALKLAEIDLMEKAAGEAPVLLLDDITAELDESRRAKVFEAVAGRCQTLVTTTRLAELDSSILEGSARFEVISGKVTPR